MFASVPYLFDHATAQFGMFGMFSDRSISKLDPKVRELGILRTGYVQGSQFVFSQHCKAARAFGLTEDQVAGIRHWQVTDCFDAKERAVLAWTDALILQGGRASDELFAALHEHLSDEDILELTYHALSYNLHAVMCKALRLEFDDVDERIREVPIPPRGEVADWRAGGAGGRLIQREKATPRSGRIARISRSRDDCPSQLPCLPRWRRPRSCSPAGNRAVARCC